MREKAERERDKAREDAINYYARIGELERERDEARKDLKITQNAWVKAKAGVVEALRERDEAQKHLRDIEEYGTEEINDAVELRQKLAAALRERDEAREEAEYWKEAAKVPSGIFRSLEMARDQAKRDAEYYRARYEKLKDEREAAK